MYPVTILFLACVFGSSLARDDKVRESDFAKVEDDLNDFYDGCGSDKFCLGGEPSCEESQDCEYFVGISLNLNESTARFQMTRKGLGYVAVGLSHDDKMGEDNVVACVHTGESSPSSEAMWSIYTLAQGKITYKKAKGYSDLSNLELSYSNGNLLCQFDLLLNSTRQSHVFDLTNKLEKLQILLVMGNATVPSGYKTVPIQHHTKHQNREFLAPGFWDSDDLPASGSAITLKQGFFNTLVVSVTTIAALFL